jgi:hypothetical protein
MNREADRAERVHGICNFRRNCLSRVGTDDYIQLGIGAQREAQLTVAHDNPTPRPSGDPVISEQPSWDRVFVPFPTGSIRGHALGGFGSLAGRTPK